MPFSNNFLGAFMPNQNPPELQVQTPYNINNVVFEAQRITNKFQNCVTFVERFNVDLADAEARGMTKTGKYIHDMCAAAHDTSLDCKMGDGSMSVGRERNSKADYASGYIDAWLDIHNLTVQIKLNCIASTYTPEVPYIYAQIPPQSNFIPNPYSYPIAPTPHNPPPIYYPPYGYYWY